MQQVLSLWSWKPVLQETIFLFPQQVESVKSKTLLWIFKFAFEIKLCWKTRPHVNFGPFFGAKRWITFEPKKISKIANKVLEKRQLRGSVPNFKARTLAVYKLKGKENCENEHRETASLCTTLYRKPKWPCNFDGMLYQLPHWIFSHGFHQKILFKRNFNKKRPKSDFRQKSNF